ncbi:MAG: PqqD family protein [Bryobacteraceae bacterium]
MGGESHYRVNEPDVIYQSFDDEVVVIHLPTGVYHSLPGLGGDVFRWLTSGGTSLVDVITSVAARYDAPRETIERDVAGLRDQLVLRHLIVPAAANGGSHSATVSENGDGLLPYVAPALNCHDDLQELFLLDPIHDVSQAGWPNLPESTIDITKAEAFQCRLAGPHVIHERFDTETVVVHANSGAYFSLYGPAEDVFLLLEHGPSYAEILRMLGKKYSLEGVDFHTVLRGFLAGLKSAGMLEAEPPAGTESRDLEPVRPGSGLPFSTLSFEFPDSTALGRAAMPMIKGLTQKQRYRLKQSDVVLAAADGAALIDRSSGSYYRLNAAATDAFRMLQSGANIEEIASQLGLRYDVSEVDIRAASMVFIAHLLGTGMIAADDSARTETWPAYDGTKKPFEGFDVAAHRDLAELILPFNPVHRSSVTYPATRPSRLSPLLRQQFEDMAGREGVSTAMFEIGGSRISVLRAGDFAPELENPWAHLRSFGGSAADLTIRVMTTGPEMDCFLRFMFESLHKDWTKDCGPRGEVLELHSLRVPVIYHPGPDVISTVDLDSGEAFYVKRDGSAPLPFWEIGSPFRYLLHSWFGDRGLQFVHGGAVGGPNGGVLLAGKGGTGKSTTSLVCARAGMQYAGDDYCLANPETGFLHSLYNTGKLKGPGDLERIPEVAGHCRNEDGFERGGSGKGIFFVSDLWPDQLTAGFPLRAVVIPRVTGERDSRLEPGSTADALAAIAPSTVGQLPGASQVDCDRIARLVSRLPVFYLDAGTDLDQIPELIRGIEGVS